MTRDMVRNSKPEPATNLTSIINSSTQTKRLKTSAEKSYQSTNSNYLIRFTNAIERSKWNSRGTDLYQPTTDSVHRSWHS
ncbi:hypothetical protein Syncc9605_0904 [Synechococcus sp. CC9605]|nr:hypothetical protein Syncc9605_0904 [Synechococcus sp. CC9605]